LVGVNRAYRRLAAQHGWPVLPVRPRAGDWLFLQPSVEAFEYPRPDLPQLVHFIGLKTNRPSDRKLRDAILTILGEPGFRTRAAVIQTDFARHDAPAEAADLLERLADTSSLPPASRDDVLYERSLSLAQYFPLTGDFWRSKRAPSSIALTAIGQAIDE
jgi:hypothetical protein